MSAQNSINAPLPLPVSQGGTGNNVELTNGQLWMGHTGNPPSISTLTGGSGISIDNATTPGNIIINSTGPYIIPSWTRVFTDTHMSGNNGYYSGLVSGSPITFYLPNIPNSGTPPYAKTGDIYSVMNQMGSTVHIKCNPSQGIYYTDTLLYTSTISTTTDGACMTLYCLQGSPGASLFAVLSTNGLPFTVS